MEQVTPTFRSVQHTLTDRKVGVTKNAMEFLSENYWESRWTAAQTGWDLRQASPPLLDFALKIPIEKRDLKILIPGCGNGWEAIELLENGFSNLTMLDFAPTAVANLQQRLDSHFSNWQAKARLVCGDFFQVSEKFDLILEQTFFCALDPSLRENYVHKMSELLTPEGRLAGLLFNLEFEKTGPPFGGSEAEYRRLFSPFFEIEKMEICSNSIAPRAGNELFFVCKKGF